MSDQFWLHGSIGPVEYAFTDARFDLSNEEGREALSIAFDAPTLAFMRQVHGDDVADADLERTPDADALLTDGPAALVRVADCMPIVIAAPEQGLAAVVHAGRVGMVSGIVARAVAALRERGATGLVAILGPRACGRCYEVPEQMAAEVERQVPGSRSRTSWGTDAIDLGAGVKRQLDELQVDQVQDPGEHVCTIEREDFFSYRRQGSAAGRFGAVVKVTS